MSAASFEQVCYLNAESTILSNVFARGVCSGTIHSVRKVGS
jgi:hypothetical protein